MNKLFVIAKNTFIETLRQPVYAVIIIAALLLTILSPSVAMYSMDDDNKLLREMGLSTIFLASLFIAIFSASGAIAEEIENGTIITVLSKPVQRPVFIIAKFLGVAGAVTMAHYIYGIGLLMAIRHGVPESVNDTADWTVISATGISIAVVLILSAFLNYTYDWKFSSTAIFLLAIFATLSIIFLGFIDKNWKFNPANNRINTLDIYGIILLLLAAIIIAALAVTLSTRFNIVITLAFCVGFFLLGLVSDYTFGQLAQTRLWAKVCYYLVPNLQVFWISDAIYEATEDTPAIVPLKYLYISGVYAFCYIGAILMTAIMLFQKRQVGISPNA